MENTDQPKNFVGKEDGRIQAFAHLHLHSRYSIGDGLIEFTKLFKKCHEFGMSSVALTDHGTLAGIASFYSQALARNIKPIVGCEFNVVDDRFVHKIQGDVKTGYHLVLLVQDQVGLENLMQLDYLAHAEGYFRVPRVDLKLLSLHNKGLICLSGCLAGRISQLIVAGKKTLARLAVLELQHIFGDNFYLELQENGLIVQRYVNAELMKLGDELDIQVVATNDNHFLEPEDADLFQQDFFGPTRDSFDSGKVHLHFKSTSRMREDFRHTPQALANTVRVASLCLLNLSPTEFIDKLKKHQQRLEVLKINTPR